LNDLSGAILAAVVRVRNRSIAGSSPALGHRRTVAGRLCGDRTRPTRSGTAHQISAKRPSPG